MLHEYNIAGTAAVETGW